MPFESNFQMSEKQLLLFDPIDPASLLKDVTRENPYLKIACVAPAGTGGESKLSTSLTRCGVTQLSSAGKMDSETSTESSANLGLSTQHKLSLGVRVSGGKARCLQGKTVMRISRQDSVRD